MTVAQMPVVDFLSLEKRRRRDFGGRVIAG